MFFGEVLGTLLVAVDDVRNNVMSGVGATVGYGVGAELWSFKTTRKEREH